jgi:hypothetical protein
MKAPMISQQLLLFPIGSWWFIDRKEL